jgi:hypothetical protein
MADRGIVAYYRSIKTTTGFARPTVEEQKAELHRRLPQHPNRKLVAEFTEYEDKSLGRDAPRPQLHRAIEATKNHPNAILVLPDMKNEYFYRRSLVTPIMKSDVQMALVRTIPQEDRKFRKPDYEWAILEKRPRCSGLSFDFGPAPFDEKVSPGEFIDVSAHDFDEIWKYVQADCSQILEILRSRSSKLLYRGLGDDRPERLFDAYISRPLDDTPPRDISGTTHEQHVSWMKQWGFQAHRGNSVFITPNRMVARNFTNWNLGSSEPEPVYAIFPFNGFKYSWSRSPADFAARADPKYGKRRVDDALWGADFAESGILDALRQQHEILFAGVPYYALRLSKFRSQIVNALKLTLHDDTPPTDNGLWSAVHV